MPKGIQKHKDWRKFVVKKRQMRYWSKIYEFQKDYRAGFTWDQLMDRYGIRSKSTVSRWKNLNLPLEALEIIEGRQGEEAAKQFEKIVKKDPELINVNLIDFVEGNRFLNLRLFPMQKLIIKCFYGIELDDWEKEKIRQLREEGRTNYESGKKYNELVLDCGMRSGKSTLAAIISCIEEKELFNTGNPLEYYGFPPGEEIFIINVATNKDQARDTIFAKTKGIIENSPFYQSRNPHFMEDEIDFRGCWKLKSGHSNSASIVGKGSKLVLFDELARFTNTKGKSSGDSVYYSLNRSVAAFKDDGRVVSISSPLYDGDMITKLFKMCFNIEGMLGFWLPTWEMNPNLPLDSKFLQKELKKNPEAFWRDFGAKPSHAVEAYYRDPKRIPDIFLDKMINPIREDGSMHDWFKGNIEFNYYLHLDPAVNNDGFGIGLSHRIGDRIIVDLAFRFRVTEGEIDYEEVKEFLLLLVDRFPTIKKASYDSYLAVSLTQALKKKGIEVEFLNVNKEVQDQLKEQIYLKNIETYLNMVLQDELENLELVNGRKVDHKRGKTKDIADGVAGSVSHCVNEEQITAAGCGGGDSEPGYEEDDDYGYSYRRRRYSI